VSGRVTEIKIGATIPTSQYANLQPEITVEIEDGDVEGAKKLALQHIVGISERYAESGRELRAAGPTNLTKVESALTGVAAYIDSGHHFYNDKGDQYLSPSSFLKKYKKPFPKQFILPKMVGAYGGTDEDWTTMWSLQGDISTQLGKAIHAGIELYGKYGELGAKAGAKENTNKALPTQPYVKWAVQEYFKGKEKDDAEYEVLVLDDENMRMGLIDRLKYVDRKKKIVRVQDLKTNADLHKKEELLTPFNTLAPEVLSTYRIQLTWYAKILEKYGYTVEGMDIEHLTADGWTTVTIEQVDMTQVLGQKGKT